MADSNDSRFDVKRSQIATDDADYTDFLLEMGQAYVSKRNLCEMCG
jgi:hypothetical protein